MVIETIFSMLTVVRKVKKMHHRLVPYLEARLAYMAAMFNVSLEVRLFIKALIIICNCSMLGSPQNHF
jgi:hypothetical protein